MEDDVVRVTAKGQATIPAQFRDMFGIQAPGRVRFAIENGLLVVRPVRSPREMRGFLADARLPEESVAADLGRERARDTKRERRRFASG